MTRLTRRRDFLKAAAAGAAVVVLERSTFGEDGEFEFDMSLVESSLNRSLAEHTLDHLDFAKVAKERFGIEAIEYGSQYFPRPTPDERYLQTLNERAGEYGVRQLLIAVDKSVRVGDADKKKQEQAKQTLRHWIEVAAVLGCHSVQVNPTSSGPPAEQSQRTIDALVDLCQFSATKRINVLVGNYGGFSAVATWVEAIVQGVAAECCRTIPRISALKQDIDYENLARLAPLAKGVTAEFTDFDEHGNVTTTDYGRALQAIQKAGYHGYVGIHYRGTKLDEQAGILASKRVLRRIRDRAR